jgi:cytochrome c oxidase subunit 4
VRTIARTLGALLALTAATTVLAYVDLGRFRGVAAMGIAGAKGLLVLAVFMHLRGSPRLFWAVALASLICLGLLGVLTMGDVLTRGWLGS